MAAWRFLEASRRVGDLEFGGFSESRLPTLEARKEMHALPYFQDEMIADEHKFLDIERDANPDVR
jgi:hypothetical protein